MHKPWYCPSQWPFLAALLCSCCMNAINSHIHAWKPFHYMWGHSDTPQCFLKSGSWGIHPGQPDIIQSRGCFCHEWSSCIFSLAIITAPFLHPPSWPRTGPTPQFAKRPSWCHQPQPGMGQFQGMWWFLHQHQQYFILQKPHRHCKDGGSRRQCWDQSPLFIFILILPCRHSYPLVAFSHYVQILDRAQISALPPCSRVVLELHPCPTTSGFAVCQLHEPPGKNLSTCMGLVSQHACICL